MFEKPTMKKLLVLFVSVLLLFACGDSVSSAEDEHSSSSIADVSDASSSSLKKPSSSSGEVSSSSRKTQASSSSVSSFESSDDSACELSSSGVGFSSSAKSSSSSKKEQPSSAAEQDSSSSVSFGGLVSIGSSSSGKSSADSSSSVEEPGISSLSSAKSSSSIEEYSSSEPSSSASPVVSSSSYYFVIPEKNVVTPKTVSLDEVKTNIQTSMLKDFFANDTFEISYNTVGITLIRFTTNVYFVSKGKDKLYYDQSLDVDYNKKTRNVINGERRKIIFLDDHSIRIVSVSQDYTDSVRTYFCNQLINPIDSTEWGVPEQINDSVYVLAGSDGSELYYNSSKKAMELYKGERLVDGELTEIEVRNEYVDGLVVKQIYKAVVHSAKAGNVEVTLTTTLNYRKADSFPDRLFEF